MRNKKVILLVLIMIISMAGTACSGNSGGSYVGNYGGSYMDIGETLSSNEGKNNLTEDILSGDFEMSDSVIEEAWTGDILSKGVYSFYNAAENLYLSYTDRSLILDTEPVSWEVKASGIGGYCIYGSNANLLFDIENAYVNEGTTIKLWENTGYDTQTWNITDNGNFTYSICSAVDSDYCLGFEGGAALLQKRDESNSAQQWIVTEMPKGYLSITSTDSLIELQMPLDITGVITETRLQQWADELQTAYYTFYELTGFMPYDSVIVEAYKPCEYTAYVIDHSNIIHIDREFIYGDLQKMAARQSDWNFCALHEMGHMFDMRRPWNFEAEAMTDLKVAYVLERNGVAAAPSEFDVSYSFYGADIVNAYEYLGGDISQSYNVYECVARFLHIKENIGWEPFVQTFHYLEENYDAYSYLTGQEKFENFISLLSYYSGTDVAGYFSREEWDCIASACK